MTEKWGGFHRIQRPWDLIFINDNFTPHIYSSATQQILTKYILCTNNEKMQHPFVLGSSWPLLSLLGWCPWRAEAHGGPFSYSSSHCCNKIDAQEEQVQPGRAHLVPSLRAHSWGRAEGSGCGRREWSGWSHLSAVWKQRNTNTCIHFLLSPTPPFIQFRTPVHGWCCHIEVGSFHYS